MFAPINRVLQHHEDEDRAIIADTKENMRYFERGITPPKYSSVDDRLSHTEAIPVMRVIDQFLVRMHTAATLPYFHKHRFAELIYVNRGICMQWIEGVSNPQDIQEGQFFLVGPSVTHALRPAKSKDIIIKFFVPIPFLSGFFDDTAKPLSQLFNPSASISNMWIRFSPGQSEAITSLLKTLLKEALLENRYQGLACKGYLGLLLIELLREGQPQISFTTRDPIHTIDQAIASFSYSENIPTLEELASRLGYHPKYLGRRVKEHYGRSYRELSQQIRLDRAIELLSTSDDTVEAIAFHLGYESPNSLYRLIRSVYGVSPSAFRGVGSILVEK